MIGRKYRKHGYNCANFVSDWYLEKLNIEIPVVNEFGRSFVVWMRRNFIDVTQPMENDLVLMVSRDGSYHIGVYHDYGVIHNYKTSNSHGSVCWDTMGVIHRLYLEVSFHRWSESNTHQIRQKTQS